MSFHDDLQLDGDDHAAAEQVGFTDEEALAFKGIYTHYDQNFGKGDGRCSVALVKSMVRALGIAMNKDDEAQLGRMLEEADENKDGSTQFPEFLVLIHMMQAVNFCGMNDVANLKVQQEEEQKQLKVKMQKRKEQGKEEFRRASLVFMEEQSAMFEALAKKAADKRDNGEDDDDDSDEEDEFHLRTFDPATEPEGSYSSFYMKYHRPKLNEWAEDRARAAVH